MNNGLSLVKIITGLSKTLSIANQLLPLYTQIKPIISKKNDLKSSLQTINNKLNKIKSLPPQDVSTIKVTNNNGGPTFFQ